MSWKYLSCTYRLHYRLKAGPVTYGSLFYTSQRSTIAIMVSKVLVILALIISCGI